MATELLLFTQCTSFQALLEEKQRARRRAREALQTRAAEELAMGNTEAAAKLEADATYTPTWFVKEYDSLSNMMMHVYKGGYWETKVTGDWDKHCTENIFELWFFLSMIYIDY